MSQYAKARLHKTAKLAAIIIVVSGALSTLAIAALIWSGVDSKAGRSHLPLPPVGSMHNGLTLPRHGAVASESQLCSDIGSKFLAQGGNAADALISTVFCVGTVAMYHAGPGGGGFALARNSTGLFKTINFKERAPAAAFEDMFVENPSSAAIGGLASAVPGELRGLQYIHENYALLPWSTLIQPSIILARDGFKITEDLHTYMSKPDQEFLRKNPSWAVDFAPNGTLKGIGEILKRPRYSKTLATISREGAKCFYEGSMAQSTIRAVQKANGTLDLEDFRNYKATGVEPMQIKYRDFVIRSDSLPAGGPQILSILKTLEGYPDVGWPGNRNLSTHRLIEAMRFSFAELGHLGDPDFNSSVTPFARYMISETAAHKRRSKILDSHTLDPSAYDSLPLGHTKRFGTSGIVTSDSDGMAFAWTSTVNGLWGSHLCVPETGIIMNNIMSDFSIPGVGNMWGVPPSPLNFPQPGKRPMDMLSNLIVEHAGNQSLYLVSSTAGGAHIITTAAQMVWHVLDRNRSASEALVEPRLHDQLHPDMVQLDWNFDNNTASSLQSLGHNVSFIKPGTSISNVILQAHDGRFDAAAEPYLTNSGASTV